MAMLKSSVVVVTSIVVVLWVGLDDGMELLLGATEGVIDSVGRGLVDGCDDGRNDLVGFKVGKKLGVSVMVEGLTVSENDDGGGANVGPPDDSATCAMTTLLPIIASSMFMTNNNNRTQQRGFDTVQIASRLRDPALRGA
jgi:hypothetical protein